MSHRLILQLITTNIILIIISQNNFIQCENLVNSNQNVTNSSSVQPIIQNNNDNTSRSSALEDSAAGEILSSSITSKIIDPGIISSAGNGGLGSLLNTNVSSLDFSQIGNAIDNIISVDEVGTWSGWIHATILMTIFWTGHLIGFGIIWILWYYWVYGNEVMGYTSYKKPNKKPSAYGVDDDDDDDNGGGIFSLIPTYSSLKRSFSHNYGNDNNVGQVLIHIIDSIDKFIDIYTESNKYTQLGV